MSELDDFKKCLEEIASKKKERRKHQEAADECYKKVYECDEELELLYEKKRMLETAFLMASEKE